MKKTLLTLVAVLLAIGGTPAQAKVHSHKVAENPDEVRAYWTAERMRDAKPIERARGGKPGGGGATTTTWSTTAVQWPAGKSDYDFHGKVFFNDGPYRYVCSGTLVNSTSGSVVWTAGHCLNEGPGAYYTNWMFVPAYNSHGATAPYGEWPATSLHTTDAWRTSTPTAYGRDLGAAKVATKGTTTLAATVGVGRTVSTTPRTTDDRLISYGYPAEGKYSGATMYACDSYISRRDTSTSPATYGIPCGMNGGSSGGGWIDSAGTDAGQLVSVNSYGYGSLKNVMFGPVQDAVAGTLLDTANRGG